MVDNEWGQSELGRDIEARSIDVERASLNPPFIEAPEMDAELYMVFLRLVAKFTEAFCGNGEVTSFDGQKFMLLLTQLAWRSMPSEHSYWSNHSHQGRHEFEMKWMVSKAKWYCSEMATLYIARALVAQGISIEEAKNKYSGPEYDYIIWPNNLIHVFDYR